MSVKKLLILGYGYLGEYVARSALERGWKVIGVTRNPERVEALEEMGGVGFRGNVNEDEWHGVADTSFDFVLNCVSSAGNGLEGYRVSYVEGNRSLASWMEAVGFEGRAVYTSSVSVYPDAEGSLLDEECVRPPDTERGRVMLESEAIFLGVGGEASKCVLRLGGIYGPGRGMLLNRLRERPSRLEGAGGYHLNLIRTEDIVSAILGIFESGNRIEGVFNVVDDEPVLKSEIVAWTAKRLGYEPPTFVGEASLEATGRGSHRRLDGGRAANRRLSNSKLKAAMEWSPQYPSFREGFDEILGRE